MIVLKNRQKLLIKYIIKDIRKQFLEIISIQPLKNQTIVIFQQTDFIQILNTVNSLKPKKSI
jgi:hypothetical protein